jgi:adenylate cyclase class IV
MYAIKQRQLLTWWLGILSTVFLLAAFVPGIGEAADMTVTSREMRLSLKSEFFTDREEGYRQYWTIVKTLATEMGVGVTEKKNAFKESGQKNRYYDTKNQDLSKNKYILRERSKIKDGILDWQSELTLKYRITAGENAFDNSIETGAAYKPAIKCEEDYTGFADGIVGKASSKTSFSHTVKKLPRVERATLGDYATIFPTLAKLGVNLNEPVYLTNGVSVNEYKVTPGALDFSGAEVAVDICAWTDEATDKLIAAELSWKHDAGVHASTIEKMDAFFTALQAKAPEWLIPGVTKTQMVSEPK